MTGRDNLIDMSMRTEEEVKRIAARGGKRSGEVRRAKRAMREQMETLLSLPLKDVNARKRLEALGIQDDEIDNQMAIIITLWNKALKGDTKAFELIRDTIGEAPIKEVKLEEVIPVPLAPIRDDD